MSHYRNLGGGRRDTNEPEIMQRFRHHSWHPEQVSGNRQWDLNAYPFCPLTKQADGTWRTLVCHVDVKGLKGKVEDAQREKWKALSEKGIPVYVCRSGADVDALVRGELDPWRPEESPPPCHARGQPCRRRKHKHPAPPPACDCGYIVGRLKTNGGHKDTCATRRNAKGMGHAIEPLMLEGSSIKAKVREVGEAMARTSVEARDEARRVARTGRGGCAHHAGSGHTPPRSTPVEVRTRLPGKARKEWRPPQSTPVDAAKEAAETFAPGMCLERGCTEPAAYGTCWCTGHTP